MLVVSHYQINESAGRSQPWRKTTYTEDGGMYYDFRKNPELIRSSLEDFSPYQHQEAVQTFYSILEWINRPDAYFETNDCALRPPAQNPDEQFLFSSRVSGRVEFFFRDLKTNLNDGAVHWLYRMLSLHLQVERPDFHSAIFDISAAPTDYLDIPGSKNECTGIRFSIHFNAYGNGDADAWNNLDIALQGLFETLRGIERGIEGGILKFPKPK